MHFIPDRDKMAALTLSAALVSDRLQDETLPPPVRDQLQYILDTLVMMGENISTPQITQSVEPEVKLENP